MGAMCSKGADGVNYKYVVLGGGNAAGYVARAFIEHGAPGADLCIITEENVVAYERPALSKGFLLGESKLPGFHTCVGGGGERQDPAWYQTHGITYLTGARVTAADVSNKVLTLAGGKTVRFEKLVVATGVRPTTLVDIKVPGGDLKGVHYLKSLADGEGLLKGMASTLAAGGQAVVIGGGYIGMEAAAGLAACGLPVTQVCSGQQFMPRLLTPELSAFYEGFYAAKGITIVRGTKPVALEGSSGKVCKVVLANGTVLPASLVVVGIGSRPCSDLFAGQLALQPDGGITVDSNLRTSSPDVFAIGDVAAFPLAAPGGGDTRVERQEHVLHARLSAVHVVDVMLGDGTPGGAAKTYEYQPYFYSRVFHLAWVFYGANEGTPVHFGDRVDGAAFGCFWVSGGRVLGVFVESGGAAANAAAKAIAAQRPAIADADLAALAQQGLSFPFPQLKL